MIEVKGNGNITSREVSVSTFIRLHLGTNSKVELHQGATEKVIVETDENLHEYVAVANAGRTLYIATEAKLRKPVFTVCVIRVFLRQLDTLYVRNVNGDVICPAEILLTQPLQITIQSVGNTSLHFTAPAVKLLNQGSGNVLLKGSGEKLDIKNQANGNFDASQFIAGELTIKNMANGDVLLHATKSIVIKHYANGYVHFSGDAVVKDVKQYGNGEIKHVKGEALV